MCQWRIGDKVAFSFGVSDNHKGLSLEMSGTMDVQEEKDMDNKGEEDDVLPELHESIEPERSRRKGKLNLRKSLAWDSAFFTDAGIYLVL